jgi:hypothetical protein
MTRVDETAPRSDGARAEAVLPPVGRRGSTTLIRAAAGVGSGDIRMCTDVGGAPVFSAIAGRHRIELAGLAGPLPRWVGEAGGNAG